jgi:hypothetical protein
MHDILAVRIGRGEEGEDHHKRSGKASESGEKNRQIKAKKWAASAETNLAAKVGHALRDHRRVPHLKSEEAG